MKKSLLSIAILAALPLNVMAAWTYVDTNTPARVANDGTVKRATYDPPYATVEPTVADETHIATTAYVKGAYNDAIAAVNTLSDVVDRNRFEIFYTLQDKLEVENGMGINGGYIERDVIGLEEFAETLGVDPNSEEYDGFGEGYISPLLENTDYGDRLMGTPAIMMLVYKKLNDKRVDIYTTWDTNATTQVTLSNAQ